MITDADYADDLVLHANTPAHAESLLLNVEQTERGIDLYVNSDKKRVHALIKMVPSAH